VSSSSKGDATFQWGGGWEVFVFEVHASGNALTTEMYSPAAIRYRQYRYCTQITHGFLGKGRRVKQATCITEGLHTMYPNPVGVDRVGFRKKPKVEKKEEQA
jgi:hypothetical protein